MTLEYDTDTRRCPIQVSESAYRALEKLAADRKCSIARAMRQVLEDALDPYVQKLTLEDQLVVAKRVATNIERRLQLRRAAK